MADAVEQFWLDITAQLPCACCGQKPVQLHHLRNGVGMSQRNSHLMVIPLCPDCHQGDNGLHGDRSRLRLYKRTETDMLADTIRGNLRQLIEAGLLAT